MTFQAYLNVIICRFAVLHLYNNPDFYHFKLSELCHLIVQYFKRVIGRLDLKQSLSLALWYE